MTIFNNNNVNVSDDNQNQESNLSYEQLLEKYKDTEGIVKAFTHAQAHINKLEREREEQRKDMESRLNLEELVSKLASRTNDTSNSGSQDQNERQEENSLKQEDIAALIEQTIERKQSELSKQANIRTVSEELRKAWGPDYVSKLKAKVQELEVSESFIDDAAAKSPKAVLSLLLAGEKKGQEQREESMFSPPKSSINTSGMSSKSASNNLKEYYSKMRKEDPKKYWSPKVQNEMFELVVQGKLEF